VLGGTWLLAGVGGGEEEGVGSVEKLVDLLNRVFDDIDLDLSAGMLSCHRKQNHPEQRSFRTFGSVTEPSAELADK
jgi:hypothetical protein